MAKFEKLDREMKEEREGKYFKMLSIIGGQAKSIDLRWNYLP